MDFLSRVSVTFRSQLYKAVARRRSKRPNHKPILRTESLEDRNLFAGLHELPELHSNPNADVKLYLDFNGYYDADWWGGSDGDPANVRIEQLADANGNLVTVHVDGNDSFQPIFDIDGDNTTFSNTELAMIRDIWRRVADDFSPFDVDVTLAEAGDLSNGHGMVAAVRFGNHGGVSHGNAWLTNASNSVYASGSNASMAATTISHEFGHDFGLNHQTDRGTPDHGPIMYHTQFTGRSTWWTLDGQSGDEMDVIASERNGIRFRPDIHGDDLSSATRLPSVFSGEQIMDGVIEREEDIDTFVFSTFDESVLRVEVVENLDPDVLLYDSSGRVIAQGSAGEAFTIPGAGEYYVQVRSHIPTIAEIDEGYKTVGNVGQYRLVFGEYESWESTEEVHTDGSGVHVHPTLTGDVNGDGKTDLIFVGQGLGGNGLYVRTKLSDVDAQGNLTWRHKHQSFDYDDEVLTNPTLTGDVNGDGLTDLIFVGQDWEGQDNNLNVLTLLSSVDSRGQVHWTADLDTGQLDGSGVHLKPTMTGDVNGDGQTDLIFLYEHPQSGLEVRTKLSNVDAAGDVTWTHQHQSLGFAEEIRSYHTGDTNGDGLTDLIFVGHDWFDSDSGLNILTLASNVDARGNTSWTTDLDSGFAEDPSIHRYPTLTGDFNGDGTTDLIFVGQEDVLHTGLYIRTRLSNVDSDGDVTWTHHHQTLGDGSGVHRYPTLTGDINGDGRTDLVFVGQNWTWPGLNIRTKLAGNNDTGQLIWTSDFEIHPDETYPNGAAVHTNATLTGDVNGDGQMDLIFVGQDWVSDGLHIRTKLSTFETPGMEGDFNGDRRLDCGDIDALVGTIVSGEGDVAFDLTNDGSVDSADVDQWLAIAAAENLASDSAYLRGDANLDGIVNSADLNMVGQNWNQAANGWCEGDFNADGIVNAADLNAVGINWLRDITQASARAATLSRFSNATTVNPIAFETAGTEVPRSETSATTADRPHEVSKEADADDNTVPRINRRFAQRSRDATLPRDPRMSASKQQGQPTNRISESVELFLVDSVFGAWQSV